MGSHGCQVEHLVCGQHRGDTLGRAGGVKEGRVTYFLLLPAQKGGRGRAGGRVGAGALQLLTSSLGCKQFDFKNSAHLAGHLVAVIEE